MKYDIYPFWSNLSTDEHAQIEHDCYQEIYEKGSIMHRSAENCKGLLSVLSGALRAYVISEEGREVTLFRVYAGDVCVLSASCLMETIDFDVMIEAVEETEVQVLPSICLNNIMQNNPYVELYLYKTATEKFSEVMWTMQQILFKKIDQRVAAFLWDELVRSNDDTLVVTHDEIAHNIGSAREVVTKVLKYMATQDILELQRGKIKVLKKDSLREIL